MENDDQIKQLRKKNWIVLGLLVVLVALFYALSFVKFGMAVHQG